MTRANVTITKRILDISGFPGGYEDQCQRMLWRGVLHLLERKPSLKMWNGARTYKNVTGVFVTHGAELKALEAAIIFEGEDVTGAMHHAVMALLAYIHKHGTENLLAHIEATDPERIYTWTGSL